MDTGQNQLPVWYGWTTKKASFRRCLNVLIFRESLISRGFHSRLSKQCRSPRVRGNFFIIFVTVKIRTSGNVSLQHSQLWFKSSLTLIISYCGNTCLDQIHVQYIVHVTYYPNTVSRWQMFWIYFWHVMFCRQCLNLEFCVFCFVLCQSRSLPQIWHMREIDVNVLILLFVPVSRD